MRGRHRARNQLVFLVLILAGTAVNAQVVHNGRVDLSGWRAGSPLELNGSWQFWPRTEPDSTLPMSLDVPGNWSSALGSPSGWGTYQVIVHLADHPPAELGLSMPLVNTAVEVRWNGARVWSVGDFRADQPGFQSAWRTGVVRVPAVGGDNTLQILVGNREDLNGGLIEPVVLGPMGMMVAQRYEDIIRQSFLFGALSIMGIYHFGLFGMRRKDRAPLWFGLVCLLIGLRGVLMGTSYASDVFPGLGWEVMVKLSYLTTSGGVLFFGLYMRALFPVATPRWFLPFLLSGAGVYALTNIVLPVGWFSWFLPWFEGYIGLFGIAIFLILVKALNNRSQGAVLFLVGFLVLFGTVVYDIARALLFLPLPALGVWGLLGYIAFQSLFLHLKFTTAFADSERHSESLSRINLSLERFIPKEVLSYLGKENIVDIQLGDHSEKDMVVMFTDIRDFTSLSESLTPQDNFRFINAYLERMGPVIRGHNGFVDKYFGDGIMALFPQSPADAMRSALEMRRVLKEYNGHRKSVDYAAVRIGIGLHWGPLMMGTIGESRRMDSTVISDTVNTASRLEGLTKKFGVDILVSEETIQALGEHEKAQFRFEFLSDETVKGRRQVLKVYSLNEGTVGL